jgi:hypothetical protein
MPDGESTRTGTAAAQAGPWSGGDIPLASRSSRQMAVTGQAFLDSLNAD